jgi:carbonic anhydrase/acetyltransferase-like protein (isoleucine patch superfamily)
MVIIMGNSNFVAPGAHILGDVRFGNNASVWFNAVIRADLRTIFIGDDSNIQDNATLHVELENDIIIGRCVTVGHNAIVHGCTVGDNTVIGMGAIVMTGAVIGENCIIGAGAVITEGTVIPPCSVVMGIPGKVIRSVTEAQIISNHKNVLNYVLLAQTYLHNNNQPEYIW